jgi:hypothetical protein
MDLKGASGLIDFELILPSAISQFAPVGLMGLILAGLLAAFMSTFAGTLNAAQAYLINDVYLNIKTRSTQVKTVKVVTYGSGILVVATGILLGFFVENVNSVLQWLVSGLFGSYVVANLLKWHWWRFNGTGFFWGMLTGMVPALILPLMLPGTLDLYYFPVLLVFSLIGCAAGTYSRPPTERGVLKEFYRNVRPWGFWGPIFRELAAEDPTIQKNSDFFRDMFNVMVGIVAQTTLIAIPIYLIFRQDLAMFVALAILAACLVSLKKFWWDRLGDGPDKTAG